MLAEATTTEISKEKKPKNLDENKIIARQGGTIEVIQEKKLKPKQERKL